MTANVHPSSMLGPDVKIAAGARIGPNCFVEGRTSIGARTVLIGGVILVGDAEIGEDCLIEPGVSMTDVLVASSHNARQLTLGAGVHIGAGSVLASGTMIGAHAQIGAGTVLTRDVPSYAIVKGNPAAIVGYATLTGPSGTASPIQSRGSTTQTQVQDCAVAGVKLYSFPRIRDLRGDLSIGEFGRNVPFVPKRYFLVFDVPSAETRGEHAHKACQQFLICTSGKVSVVVDDGSVREEFDLDAPNIGLYIPPRIWGIQYKYSPDAVLLVFASHFYDPADYIRNYDEFLETCRDATANAG